MAYVNTSSAAEVGTWHVSAYTDDRGWQLCHMVLSEVRGPSMVSMILTGPEISDLMEACMQARDAIEALRRDPTP